MREGAGKWLGLAVLGGLAPLVLVIVFLAQEGLDFGAMGDQLGEPLALAAAADLTISSLVFWIWMWPRAWEETRKSPWLFVVTNALIGLSFALPLFFYFRARSSG